MSPIAKDKVLFRVFQVKPGWCAFARTKDGVCRFILPVESREAATAAILKHHPEASESKRSMDELVQSVNRYFHGWRTEFDSIQLDLTAGTEFQQRVWSLARRITYGNVRTYGWVALEIGRPKATRAIGNAMGANPVPLIIPCHRVVTGDGKLGGFSAHGGPALKAEMLKMEGVRLIEFGDEVRVIA
jgi:methylated-DNA-[protein]-cysteine S-methyltransferase